MNNLSTGVNSYKLHILIHKHLSIHTLNTLDHNGVKILLLLDLAHNYRRKVSIFLTNKW